MSPVHKEDKSMFEIFWKLKRSDTELATERRADANDPLAHPAIERMSERELADLPLGARLAAVRSAPADIGGECLACC
jgi:hypothetical protein